MKDPGRSESWKLWCLALTLASAPKEELDSHLAKQKPQQQIELQHRIGVIRRTKAIPVGEFL